MTLVEDSWRGHKLRCLGNSKLSGYLLPVVWGWSVRPRSADPGVYGDYFRSIVYGEPELPPQWAETLSTNTPRMGPGGDYAKYPNAKRPKRGLNTGRACFASAVTTALPTRLLATLPETSHAQIVCGEIQLPWFLLDPIPSDIPSTSADNPSVRCYTGRGHQTILRDTKRVSKRLHDTPS